MRNQRPTTEKLSQVTQLMRSSAKEAHMSCCSLHQATLSRKPQEKEWPSLLCFSASGKKDQDRLEARTTASPVLQPGALIAEQYPGSNLSKHTEAHNPVLTLKGTAPDPWFHTDHADSAEAVERGLKGPCPTQPVGLTCPDTADGPGPTM